MDCSYSLLSRGTERRHALLQRSADVRPGYINIAQSGSQFWIRSLPHGVSGTNEKALECQASSIDALATARIQLVAAAGLHHKRKSLQLDQPVLVIGSGPVAIGAALELRRLGCPSIIIKVKRQTQMAEHIRGDGVAVEWKLSNALKFDTVIDAVGCDESISLAIQSCKSHGSIGILGTPLSTTAIDLYQVHRKNINVFGLHELNAELKDQQILLKQVYLWVYKHCFSLSQSLCEMHPGREFYSLYPQLLRHSLPFKIHGFNWGEL